MTRDPLRTHLQRALDWGEAHVSLEAALKGIPPEMRGRRPDGLPYSPWQILEHMRIAQRDILEFWRNPRYVEMTWPDDYWPQDPEPPTATAWDESVASFVRDRDAARQLIADGTTDLFGAIPHGTGQTYLREAILLIDHNAYHLGQLVAVRRLLGIW